MKEVTKERFQEILNEIPYKTSFVLGQSGIRYEGKGKKFKNSLFAIQKDGKYFVDTLIS